MSQHQDPTGLSDFKKSWKLPFYINVKNMDFCQVDGICQRVNIRAMLAPNEEEEQSQSQH